MDDYKQLNGYSVKVKPLKSAVSHKGHEEEWMALYEALRQGRNPIDINCLLRTTELSILSAQE